METTRDNLGLFIETWCLYTRNLVSLHKKPLCLYTRNICVFTQETLCFKIYHAILNGHAKEIAIWRKRLQQQRRDADNHLGSEPVALPPHNEFQLSRESNPERQGELSCLCPQFAQCAALWQMPRQLATQFQKTPPKYVAYGLSPNLLQIHL